MQKFASSRCFWVAHSRASDPSFYGLNELTRGVYRCETLHQQDLACSAHRPYIRWVVSVSKPLRAW